jgi:hypothetical protein
MCGQNGWICPDCSAALVAANHRLAKKVEEFVALQEDWHEWNDRLSAELKRSTNEAIEVIDKLSVEKDILSSGLRWLWEGMRADERPLMMNEAFHLAYSSQTISVSIQKTP